MLPTQSPAAAADELERTVTTHRFVGALINGHTHGRYLDDRFFDVLFARAEALDVPVYIHPTDPPLPVIESYFAPYTTALVPTWGWPVETGTHLLRLVCGGTFDRFPDLKVIVGHMGELLPYCFTRLNLGMTMADWLLTVRAEKGGGPRTDGGMRNSLAYYMKRNVYVTSSGVFDQPVFDCARAALGLENMMFSVDEPFQDPFEAMSFLAGTSLTNGEREMFAHGTAEQLLKLQPTATTTRTPHRSVGETLYRFSARARSRVGRALIGALVR